MGPELEPKEKSVGRLEGLAAKENGCALKNSENRLMQCMSNYEDTNFLVEPSNDDQCKVQDGSEDVEVNIVDCTNCGDVEPIEARCDDATESMSSFGDTESETENGSIFSDGEVESRLCINDDATYIFDGFGYPFQMSKKKFTDHWTRFIRPVASRCRWLELHIKELVRQAQKYDRKLAEIENKKQFANESFLVEGVEAKTQPFLLERKVKVMKRRRRLKIEETVDVDSYMSQHNFFSLYENKKSATDAFYLGEDYGNPEKIRNDNDEFGFQDGWATLESKGDDNNIHEIFLRKIDALQLLVRKLKKRIDKVVNENSGKFSSFSRPSLHATCDALNCSEQNPSSPLENGDSKPVKSLYTQQLSKGDVGNLLPESIVSTHEEAKPISDIIENSILPHVGVSCQIEEEILIHNQAAKEEIQSLKNFGGQLANNLQVSTEKAAVQASEANLLTESFMARVQFGGKTLPKSRTNNSTGKRKRGKRKSAGGRRRK